MYTSTPSRCKFDIVPVSWVAWLQLRIGLRYCNYNQPWELVALRDYFLINVSRSPVHIPLVQEILILSQPCCEQLSSDVFVQLQHVVKWVPTIRLARWPGDNNNSKYSNAQKKQQTQNVTT